MVESGDWVKPRLDYLDYVEKPPLWYWAAGASYEVFGVSEAAARLPLALLACAALLLTAWLGSWLYDLRAGLCGAAALGSAALFFFLSHYITLDLPLTVMLLAETGLMLRCLLRPKDARWAAPAAWVAAALALLSKGLVAIVLPGFWLASLLALFPAMRRPARGLLSPLGVALGLAIGAPWFALMERRVPGFFHFFFVEQHFQRFLTDKYNRNSPIYFFLLVLPAVALPWTPAALTAFARRPRKWLEQPSDAALALWIVCTTVFFSISRSKLATYILPVMPHLCLLASRAAEKPLPLWARRLSLGLGAALLGAALAAPFVKEVPPEALPWGVFGVAALAAALIAQFWLNPGRGLIGALTAGGLALGACGLLGLRSAERLVSAKSVAQAVAAQARVEDSVWTYQVYLQGLPFYLRRPVDKIVYWIGELHYAKRDPANAARFADDSDVRALPQQSWRTFVVLPSREARHFMSLTQPDSVSAHASFGRWELAQFLSAEELPRRR